MSYSRWGNSTWYTFWSANSPALNFKWPTKQLKDGQIFQICDFNSFSFTYKNLQDWGMARLVLKIRKFYSKDRPGEIFNGWTDDKKPVYKETVWPAKNPTADELIELIDYIRTWERDVEDEFRFWIFIKNYWYYPMVNRIKKSIKSTFNKND